MQKKLLAIIGSTASGKSALAIECALRYNGEIISSDSRQVYKHLDATTGKVTEEEQHTVPHHMLHVAEPGDIFTVFDFKKQALPIIESIFARGKLPILVGGTGFYMDAILYENTTADIPPDTAYRKSLEEQDIKTLQKKLKEADSDAFNRIDTENPRRLIRALEIIRSLGFLPILKRKERYPHTMVGIQRSRPELRKRIEERLDARFQDMTKEIKGLLADDISKDWFNRLGLECRHIARMLIENISEEETKKNLTRAIFAYAKRQDSWWRRYPQAQWFRENEFKKLHAHIRNTFP